MESEVMIHYFTAESGSAVGGITVEADCGLVLKNIHVVGGESTKGMSVCHVCNAGYDLWDTKEKRPTYTVYGQRR